ncbi:MAG TPA: Hsp20/alpha crystallin family protein [Polyangiaceae bacterium]|jgi:HSP20 family protein
MAFLNRWDPFTEIARLQDEMTRHLAPPTERRGYGFIPPVDIYEDKDAIYVKAELPGVKPDEVKLHVENNILTLTGERKFEKEEKKEGYHRVERSYGTFTRSFALPNNVVGEQVAADMADGVLTVKLPKKAEPQPRRIEVRSGPPAKPVIPS